MFDFRKRDARPSGVVSSVSRRAGSSRKLASSSSRNVFHPRRMSSVETRKLRSIKKFRVVCQAAPRSRRVPRPSPSRFQRNSLRPLDTRVAACSGARDEPADPALVLGGAAESDFEPAVEGPLGLEFVDGLLFGP